MTPRIHLVKLLTALLLFASWQSCVLAASDDSDKVNRFKPTKTENTGSAASGALPPGLPPVPVSANASGLPPAGGLPPVAGSPINVPKYLGTVNGVALYRTDDAYRFDAAPGPSATARPAR